MKQFFSCLSSRSNYKGLNLFFTFLAFFLFSSLFVFPLQSGHCNQVTLTWDPNTEPDLAGYEIYYGTSSGNYQWNIDIGNATTYTLYGLNVGVTYYIAATAYNTQGLQSGYSNEVVYTVSSCTYTISPSSATFSSLGGSGSVLVTTQAGCNWGTSASIPWITVTSGSGMGSGTMSYSVSPNTGAIRTASFTIAGNIFTVTEAGLSAYVITASAGAGGSISPSGQVSILAGAGQTFTITPNTGYQIADVMVDGVSQGPITSYTFSSVSANHTITASFTSTQHTDKVDFDNDGKTDLLWRNDQNGQIAVWYMNGITPTRSTVIAPSYDTNWELIGTGDFNGDGSTDILWRHQVTGQLSLRLIHGETSTAQGSPGTVDRDWEIKGIGDFNGDGKADILWRHRVTGQVYIWLMNGETPIAQGSPGTVDQGWEIKGLGDFNGDGKADILWRHRVTGQLYVWLMNGTTIASMGSPGTISDPSWNIKGVGDFNGDGKADILWRNEVSGQLYVWLMDGTAIASQGSPGTVDRGWEIKGLGDFNGDGKADIIWRHSLSGMLYVWIMNGTIVSSMSSPGTVSDSHWKIVTP